MLWLTWRQHRMQALVTAGFLLVVGVFLLLDGMSAQSFLDNSTPAGCPGSGSACQQLARTMSDRFQNMNVWLSWLPLLPAVVGMFWGAPVVAREFEGGTHKLVWTQSVSRARWLFVKLGVLGLAVLLAGIAMGSMMSAWLGTYEPAMGDTKFGDTAMFALSGVVPGFWWLFSFAAGVAAGAVLRKLIPAMAVTIVVFIILTVALFTSRDLYADPVRVLDTDPTYQSRSTTIVSGYAWQSADGRELPRESAEIAAVCDDPADIGSIALQKCAQEHGYQQVRYIQPTERYWRFQWTESGILLLGSVLLLGLAVRTTLRRRV